MPRNGAGVFNLAQPAFQSQTPISSGAMNSDLSDIADGLTGSLPRDGQASMTAVLPLASTGFTYAADPNTGMRRTAADAQAIQCGGVDVAEFTATGVNFPLDVTIDGAPIVPAGSVISFGGAAAPTGWLLCFGQAVSRTTYAALFAVIGTVFGSGDGATTFNLPDIRGRVDAGKDDMGGAAAGRLTGAQTGGTNGAAIGNVGGEQGHIIVQAELASHFHGGVTGGMTGNDPHTHAVTGGVLGGTTSFPVGGPTDRTMVQNPTTITISATSVAHSHLIPADGANSAHNTVQPTIILNKIIKT